MKNENNVVLSCLGLGLLAVLGMIGGTILEGVVLVKLWEWFVIPIFDVRALYTAEAIGLSLVTSLLTYQFIPENKNDGRNSLDKWTAALGVVFLKPVFYLLAGWLVYQFI